MHQLILTTPGGIECLKETRPFYLVAGARPNFIKLAPLVWELDSRKDIPYKIIHTGQHYDYAMSQAFFDVLNIPEPDVNLGVGSGEQNIQTARILEHFDELIASQPPRAVVVFGDVNSTLACSLAAAKRLVPVAHVEAGLRSFDRTMPEEINRLVTDTLSDLLLVSENSGLEHLKDEGVPDEKVVFVGNIMIDSLVKMKPKALAKNTAVRLGQKPGQYALLTLHRPANVDDPAILNGSWICLVNSPVKCRSFFRSIRAQKRRWKPLAIRRLQALSWRTRWITWIPYACRRKPGWS